ncbi:MAG: hypothetical protein QXR30_03600 [Candidatus Woesearchaeota archaeon]
MIEEKIYQKGPVEKPLNFDLESLIKSFPEDTSLEKVKQETDVIHNHCINQIYDRLNCVKKGMVFKNLNYYFDNINKGELDFAWYDPEKKRALIVEVKGKENDKKRRKAREQLLKDLIYLMQNYEIERALLVSAYYDEIRNKYYVRSEFFYNKGVIRDLANGNRFLIEDKYSPDYVYDKSHW